MYGSFFIFKKHLSGASPAALRLRRAAHDNWLVGSVERKQCRIEKYVNKSE